MFVDETFGSEICSSDPVAILGRSRENNNNNNIPVIIGATGIVTRNFRKNLETVPGKHSIDSLQKTAILGTSHIIRKVLQCEA